MSAGRVGVGFDVDHTIAIDNKLERIAFLRLLEPIVADGGAPLGSLDDEIVRIDQLLVRQRAGAFSIDDAVRGFARERGAGSRAGFYVECFRTAALEMVDELVVPLPGARRAFDVLREAGVRVAALSNGWNPLQTRKARRAGFEGPVVASAEIGAQKPDRRAFEALCEVLETAAERTWYVGDDPGADVAGARNAGLHSLWLNGGGTPFPPFLPPPELAAASLGEAASLLLSAIASPARIQRVTQRLAPQKLS